MAYKQGRSISSLKDHSIPVKKMRRGASQRSMSSHQSANHRRYKSSWFRTSNIHMMSRRNMFSDHDMVTFSIKHKGRFLQEDLLEPSESTIECYHDDSSYVSPPKRLQRRRSVIHTSIFPPEPTENNCTDLKPTNISISDDLTRLRDFLRSSNGRTRKGKSGSGVSLGDFLARDARMESTSPRKKSVARSRSADGDHSRDLKSVQTSLHSTNSVLDTTVRILDRSHSEDPAAVTALLDFLKHPPARVHKLGGTDKEKWDCRSSTRVHFDETTSDEEDSESEDESTTSSYSSSTSESSNAETIVPACIGGIFSLNINSPDLPRSSTPTSTTTSLSTPVSSPTKASRREFLPTLGLSNVLNSVPSLNRAALNPNCDELSRCSFRAKLYKAQHDLSISSAHSSQDKRDIKVSPSLFKTTASKYGSILDIYGDKAVPRHSSCSDLPLHDSATSFSSERVEI